MSITNNTTSVRISWLWGLFSLSVIVSTDNEEDRWGPTDDDDNDDDDDDDEVDYPLTDPFQRKYQEN